MSVTPKTLTIYSVNISKFTVVYKKNKKKKRIYGMTLYNTSLFCLLV